MIWQNLTEVRARPALRPEAHFTLHGVHPALTSYLRKGAQEFSMAILMAALLRAVRPRSPGGI